VTEGSDGAYVKLLLRVRSKKLLREARKGVVTSLPTKVKQARKKPESRAILYARLKIQEQAIDQLLAEKEALEDELTTLKLEKARWIVQSRERHL
jgi:hypothetical protein